MRIRDAHAMQPERIERILGAVGVETMHGLQHPHLLEPPVEALARLARRAQRTPLNIRSII